jgi:hypothetical protein
LKPTPEAPNRVYSGGNFNTGVEAAEKDDLMVGLTGIVTFPLDQRTPTRDTGFRNGRSFQAPQLFALNKRQFFHSGLLGNQAAGPNPGETEHFMSILQAIKFYRSPEFAANNPALFQTFQGLTENDMRDIAHFLVAISGAISE